MSFVANKVQQKIDTQLPLPLFGTKLPESHPCVGVSRRVIETAVTHRQVETQCRGQLDIVHALVRLTLGQRVHLAFQHHEIQLPIADAIAANG